MGFNYITYLLLMKKLFLRKISILGLVLIVASAVAAAVFPIKKKPSNIFDLAGSLTASDEYLDQFSCTTTQMMDSPCHKTNSVGIIVPSGSTAKGASRSNQSTLWD